MRGFRPMPDGLLSRCGRHQARHKSVPIKRRRFSMFIRGKTLVRKGPHVAALAFVLVLVASLSSAGAATYPVAQPGVSVFKYPNHTWDPSSLPRYATEVVTAPSLLAGIKTASPTTKVLNY